jgi:hypothetical protein
MDEIARHVEEAKPALSRALIRYGKGFKEAWFVRCDEPFGRIHTRRWLAPGADLDKDGTHVVEIFGGASPRQFGAFGAHTREPDGSVTIAYAWDAAPQVVDDVKPNGDVHKKLIEKSPLTVPLAELPEISKKEVARAIDIIEEVAMRRGYTVVMKSTKGENPDGHERVYDLTPAMRFECNDGVTRTLEQLQALAGETGLRCSASWLEPGVGHSLTR